MIDRVKPLAAGMAKPLLLLAASGWALWVASEPMASASPLVWKGEAFRTPASVALTLGALAVQGVLLWQVIRLVAGINAGAWEEKGGIGRLLTAALLIGWLTWSFGELGRVPEVLLIADRPLGFATLLFGAVVVGLLIAAFRDDLVATIAETLLSGWSGPLLLAAAATVARGVLAFAGGETARSYPEILGLAAGMLRLATAGAGLLGLAVLARPMLERSRAPAWSVSLAALAACAAVMLIRPDPEPSARRIAVRVKLDAVADAAMRADDMEAIGKLLDQYDALRAEPAGGQTTDDDLRRGRIAGRLRDAWGRKIEREHAAWARDPLWLQEPGFLATLDAAIARLGAAAFGPEVDRWAADYLARLRQLDDRSLLEQAGRDLPRWGRHLDPARQEEAREALRVRWTDRVERSIAGDLAAAKAELDAADKAFPGAWADQRRRIREACVPWAREAIRQDLDPEEVVRRIWFATTEEPTNRAPLVAEYLARVARRVDGLLAVAPDAAKLEPALRWFERKPPEAFDGAIIGRRCGDARLFGLEHLVAGPGRSARDYLARFRPEDRSSLGTDFKDLLERARRSEEAAWRQLAEREERAGRHALALELSLKLPAATVRGTLRRKVARDWFERVFAGLAFEGRDQMPAPTIDSAEALMEGLLRSRGQAMPILVRQDRQGVLFAVDGAFVYRKGPVSQYVLK